MNDKMNKDYIKQLTMSFQKSYSFLIAIWGQFCQYVYDQFLLAQIPKVQKESQVISVFLHFWDLRVQKMLVKRL